MKKTFNEYQRFVARLFYGYNEPKANKERRTAMKKEAIQAIRDYMSAALCVSGEVKEKAEKALEALEADDWHPVCEDDPASFPPAYEMVLISFSGKIKHGLSPFETTYKHAFSLADYGLEEGWFINKFDKAEDMDAMTVEAWMPLPGPYRPEGGEA